MNFTRAGNVLTSDDGRFRIERMSDHRGPVHNLWDTQPPLDWGWALINSYVYEEAAKRACDFANKFGGTV